MKIIHGNLRCPEALTFFFFSFLLLGIEALSIDKCVPDTELDVKNRDEVRPSFPLLDDPRIKTSNILEAHKILRNGLQQYLEFREEDLGFYLNHIVQKKPIFKDEYGQEIRSYIKVFKFIWKQYNETLCANYATKQYDVDKLDLCSAVRFLSHQPSVNDSETIMKKMGDALGYKCHPCTPYKRREYGGTVVPSTDDFSLIEGLSTKEIFVLCKDYDHQGQKVIVSSTTQSATTFTSTTTPPTIITSLPTTTTATKAPAAIANVEPSLLLLDYTPCSYSSGNVVCEKVPLEEVQKVFRRTSFPRLASTKLTLHPFIFIEKFIPEDIFGTKLIFDITLEYSFDSGDDIELQVDANAFRSTKNYTNKFTINMIDCTYLDLGFLKGFDKLTNLKFNYIYNIQHCLSSLPSLPRLTELRFEHCSGMNELNNFPVLTNGLKTAIFLNNEISKKILNMTLNDATVDRIMDWLLLSSSDTLEELAFLFMTQVTRVPHKITSLKALSTLWLYDNSISTIKSGELSFSVPVSKLNIKDNGIKKIEADAFQGNFKHAEVYVHNNYLTQFEESVFGSMLHQMASGNGFIAASAINANPIDCSKDVICNLAWLRNYQADVKFWLKCSNGTSFKDLQPAGFNHCP